MNLSRLRPRFTVRRLMITVAIVALLVGVFAEMRHRQRKFGRIAMIHWFKALADANSTNERKQNFHTHMWVKYQRAADYPWLPVWPDPPEPD
jgi:hypothetical protein